MEKDLRDLISKKTTKETTNDFSTSFRTIDHKVLEKLLFNLNTREQIAAYFCTSEDAINDYVLSNYGGLTFEDLQNTLRARREANIRDIQFSHAQSKSDMAKFVGQVYLGQKIDETITEGVVFVSADNDKILKELNISEEENNNDSKEITRLN